MKKGMTILAVWALLVLTGCMIFSAFAVYVPVALTSYSTSYKMLTGIKYFLMLFPAIVFSGFITGCSIQWKSRTGNSLRRFSSAMVSRFKKTIVTGIILVLLLSLSREVFIPAVHAKLTDIENRPAELRLALDTAHKFFEEDSLSLAIQYAKKAERIDPSDPQVRYIIKAAEDALEVRKNSKAVKKEEAPLANQPLHSEDSGYTIFELVKKARKAASEHEWFNAHYYAKLAADACNGTNTNYQEAMELANLAWNNLQRPEPFTDNDEKTYFETKRKAYSAFTSGDYLKAYYIFNSLLSYKNVKPTDDVKRFFELSRESVENQYFFFDETDRMQTLTDSHNIYFSIPLPDGTKDVVHIKGSMELKKEGSLVRYLEGLTIVNFTKFGNFNYSFSVPFAKVLAQPTSGFSAETKRKLGIKEGWDYVPLLLLHSVDRSTEGLISRPVYKYASFYYDKKDESSIRIVPMNYADFAPIISASRGAENIGIISLASFIQKAQQFGFSKETFRQSLLGRITYPMFLLTIIMLCAVIGWDYRIEGPDTVFKFSWLLGVPVCTVFSFVVYKAAVYIFDLINYVITGLFPSIAMFIAWIFYIAMFTAASVFFLSRKA